MEEFLPLLRNVHISKLSNKTEATCESPFFVIDFDKKANAFENLSSDEYLMYKMDLNNTEVMEIMLSDEKLL